MFSNELWQKSGVSTYSIDQSIRFNDSDSPILKKTYSSAGTEETFTLSMWVKRGAIGAGLGASNLGLTLFSGGADVSNYGEIVFRSSGHSTQDCLEFYNSTSGSTNMMLKTNRLFRDPSAWMHLVFVMDTTNAVATERMRIYVNGSRVTNFSTETYPSQNAVPNFNTATEHGIGGFAVSTDTRFFDGYLAEIVFIDGQALDETSFGETTSDGIWKPIDVSGLTFGTNGFYIKGENASDLGNDSSSNNNDFTTSGLASHDQVLDSPTNNFAVLSSISNAIDETLSNGNLQIAYGSATTRTGIYAPYGMTSGKWYWEVYIQAATNNPARVNIGIASTTENDSATRATSIGYYPGYTAVGWSYYGFNGKKINNSSEETYGNTFTAADIIGVAYDADNGNLFFYKNGTIQNSGTAAYTGLSTSETYYPAIGDGGASDTMTCQMNFGQEGTFAGNVTAGGNSDGSGIGNFKYSVPSGYKALCTKNLGS